MDTQSCTRPSMKKIFFLLGVTVVLSGCRGTLKEDPPIHINPNMDEMERFEAQEANPFFADGRAMRPPVPGTVARGMLREDAQFHTGRNADGSYVQVMPVEFTSRVRQPWPRAIRYLLCCLSWYCRRWSRHRDVRWVWVRAYRLPR